MGQPEVLCATAGPLPTSILGYSRPNRTHTPNRPPKTHYFLTDIALKKEQLGQKVLVLGHFFEGQMWRSCNTAGTIGESSTRGFIDI